MRYSNLLALSITFLWALPSIAYAQGAGHRVHLRTTHPIKSTFATVRLRHRRTKRNGSRAVCLAMVFTLVEIAPVTHTK